MAHSASIRPPRSADALDAYANEFATLVDQCPPRRSDAPSDWLGRLPDEVFRYYAAGIATYGGNGGTPAERRGRLYLMHTAIVCLWITWGRKKARKQFRKSTKTATRRAASLVSLEHYRRTGVLRRYKTEHWFYQPIDQWTASIETSVLDVESIEDPTLHAQAQTQAVLSGTVKTIATLRASGALPKHIELC